MLTTERQAELVEIVSRLAAARMATYIAGLALAEARQRLTDRQQSWQDAEAAARLVAEELHAFINVEAGIDPHDARAWG